MHDFKVSYGILKMKFSIFSSVLYDHQLYSLIQFIFSLRVHVREFSRLICLLLAALKNQRETEEIWHCIPIGSFSGYHLSCISALFSRENVTDN